MYIIDEEESSFLFFFGGVGCLLWIFVVYIPPPSPIPPISPSIPKVTCMCACAGFHVFPDAKKKHNPLRSAGAGLGFQSRRERSKGRKASKKGSQRRKRGGKGRKKGSEGTWGSRAALLWVEKQGEANAKKKGFPRGKKRGPKQNK